jgi:hypothetical protein
MLHIVLRSLVRELKTCATGGRMYSMCLLIMNGERERVQDKKLGGEELLFFSIMDVFMYVWFISCNK